MNPDQPTLTQQLTDLVLAKPVSADDLDQAALFTLDALASAVAGCSSAAGRHLLDWARVNGRDAGRRAFLLGALAHIQEMDDLHRASVVHPGCVVVPAAWAVAVREQATGPALLTAVLHGFEAACRVGMAVGPTHYRYWHNTATCGPFGSALAVATLLRLNPAATVNALGNAGTQSAGLWQFLETGAMTKHLHAGRAAEAGVLAADLARYHFTGPPAILEGARGLFAATCPDADPAAVLRDPDAPWQLRQTSLKPWPSCRHTHAAIAAAQSLHLQCDPYTIARIEVETYPAALALCDRPQPQSAYHAKFSLQHCVAAALSGPVDFVAFETRARTALAALAGRVTLQVAEPYTAAYPAAWGSAVTVIMADGSRQRAECTQAKGDPEAPLTRDEIIAKANRLLHYGGAREAQRLIDGVLGLPAGGPIPDLPEDLK
jgi:2-methylcitrate dehydratase PrpD